MRIQLEQGINNCQVMGDTYPNDLAGLQAVLNFMARQNRLLSKTLILTDLWELGVSLDAVYHQLAHLLQGHGVNRLIGIGQALSTYAPNFHLPQTHFYPDLATFLHSDLLSSLQAELIAIKGDQGGMNTLYKQLAQYCHGTILEIDLAAIAHNLHFFRSQLAQDTKIVVMLKAFSYGSSRCEVAQLLEHSGVDYLAVVYADEGVNLRQQGITLPIMVMNPMPPSFHKLINYQLEPVIYSLELLKDLKAFLTSQQHQLPIHLKLETGMHRLGFEEKELEAVIQNLQNIPSIQVKSVLSHLAASGTLQHDAYTHAQADLFQKMAHRLEAGLGIKLIKHLLNTSGIVRFPAYQFDMVRLGIGLYGVGVDTTTQPHLKVASRLKTTIAQIKHIPAGATVGYERRGKVSDARKVATLAIGYADGFSRALGNGKSHVWINGQLAPVLGDVCMDMMMVDITHIEAQPGDEVVIFGPEYPIAQVAAAAHTISYEILTNGGERVRRVYYQVTSS